jgi:hypothetical protein
MHVKCKIISKALRIQLLRHAKPKELIKHVQIHNLANVRQPVNPVVSHIFSLVPGTYVRPELKIKFFYDVALCR